MSTARALARYWFILPLLLIVVVVQLGVGFVTTNSAASNKAPTNSPAASQVNTAVPSRTPLPTFTATATPSPVPSFTPTFTPSPTRTPIPTNTPTGLQSATSVPSPSATPTPTPLPTPTVQGVDKTVPILMYHYLSVPPANADAIRRDLSVSPAQFEAHLAYLRQAGYQTISLQQLIYALSQKANLPAKPIIITFDDGYRDNYDNAFPLLRQYGYTATFFVFTQPIDSNNVDYLSWDMVTEMHKAGMEFGSHSYSHPDMSGKDVDFQVFEVLASKEAVEERTGEPVRFFAYPSGRYDALTIRVLKSAHFWGAVTTQWGADQSYSGRFEMSRVRVRGNDRAEDLAEKLQFFSQD